MTIPFRRPFSASWCCSRIKLKRNTGHITTRVGQPACKQGQTSRALWLLPSCRPVEMLRPSVLSFISHAERNSIVSELHRDHRLRDFCAANAPHSTNQSRPRPPLRTAHGQGLLRSWKIKACAICSTCLLFMGARRVRDCVAIFVSESELSSSTGCLRCS